jgi:hypothetical protein
VISRRSQFAEVVRLLDNVPLLGTLQPAQLLHKVQLSSIREFDNNKIMKKNTQIE